MLTLGEMVQVMVKVGMAEVGRWLEAGGRVAAKLVVMMAVLRP